MPSAGLGATAISWKDGKWTAVVSRKLVTGSKTDVQFEKLGGTYEFGFAPSTTRRCGTPCINP